MPLPTEPIGRPPTPPELLAAPAITDGAPLELDAGSFCGALVGDPERARVLKLIRRHLEPGRRVFTGVVAPLDPRAEAAEGPRDRVLEAAPHAPPDQLGTALASEALGVG